MKIYYRYIFGKIASTSIMMLLLLTSIVWSIEIMNIGRGGILIAGIGPIKFIYLCSFILPYDATLIWPMSMFFGVLMTINQMQQRGEFLAFRALGFSHAKLFGPIFLFALISTIVCYFLTMQVAPILYKELRIRQSAAEEKAILSMLHKKKFNNFNGNTIYFENIDESGFATNIIIWQNSTPEESSIISADSLKFVKRSDGITVIVLENAIDYKIATGSGKKSSISTSKATYITLSSIVKPKRIDVANKRFYLTGLKKLYDASFVTDNKGEYKEEFHNRIIRPFYSIIMAVFVYAIMAGRNGMRGNELKYIIKYILAFAALTIFGAESTKYFAQTKFWYLCYVISLAFLFYGCFRIIRMNYYNIRI